MSEQPHSEGTIQTDTYEILVAQQLARYSQQFGGEYDPLVETGTFSLKEKYGEIPIWGLPFGEKPAQPKSGNSQSFIIDDEKKLIELEIPRSVRAVYIEREIILDRSGYEALVERMYFVKSASGERELICVGALTKKRDSSSEETGYLVSQYADNRDIFYRQSINVGNIRGILLTPLPIVTGG